MLADLLKAAGTEMALTMLEIGAMPLGPEPERFRGLLQTWPKSKVLAFEVDPAVCTDLNAKSPHGVRFYPVALGKSRERLDFHETQHPMCGSFYRPDERDADKFHNLDVMRLKAVSQMDTVPLDVFVDEQGVGPVDFIKMDIQGAELDVLQGAARVLQDVVAIVSEVEFVPLYVGQPLYGDVDAFLREQGFVFHKFLGLAGRTAKPLVFNRDFNLALQQMWADAVFVRDFFRLDCAHQ